MWLRSLFPSAWSFTRRRDLLSLVECGNREIKKQQQQTNGEQSNKSQIYSCRGPVRESYQQLDQAAVKVPFEFHKSIKALGNQTFKSLSHKQWVTGFERPFLSKSSSRPVPIAALVSLEFFRKLKAAIDFLTDGFDKEHIVHCSISAVKPLKMGHYLIISNNIQ